MRGLEEDLKDCGIECEERREAAQKAGRWFRRVEDEAKAFMRKRHDAESRVAVRHATVAILTRTVDTHAQARERWG